MMYWRLLWCYSVTTRNKNYSNRNCGYIIPMIVTLESNVTRHGDDVHWLQQAASAVLQYTSINIDDSKYYINYK